MFVLCRSLAEMIPSGWLAVWSLLSRRLLFRFETCSRTKRKQLRVRLSHASDFDTVEPRTITIERARGPALFDVNFHSTIQGFDRAVPRLSDVTKGAATRKRASVLQRISSRAIPFELTERP